jgi:hypothetical protein
MMLYKKFYRTSTMFKPTVSRPGIFKPCNTCKHQIKVVYDNVTTNRCMKFMIPLKDGTIIYEQTTTVRNNQQKCGPNGEFYSTEHMNKHPYSDSQTL